VALNFLWIPRFGRMGAAEATLASFGILFAATAWLSRRAYGFQFETGRVGRAVLVMGAFGVAGLALLSETYPQLFLFQGAALLASGIWAGAWYLKDLGIRWIWSREPGQAWLRWVRTD
jgi:O-antigen/teichoic acid export membrane protein